jgi:hypothetical protein
MSVKALVIYARNIFIKGSLHVRVREVKVWDLVCYMENYYKLFTILFIQHSPELVKNI